MNEKKTIRKLNEIKQKKNELTAQNVSIVFARVPNKCHI